MKPKNENDVLKKSIVLMENYFTAKLNKVNKELAHQNEEKEKRANELIIANKELEYQNKVKEERSEALVLANKELAFQNEEKEKRAAELVVVNKELTFQNGEKERCELELSITNKKLIFKTHERQIKSAELNIANRELDIANLELKKAEENQKKYIKGLDEIMFMTSHRVRQPIANIIGFSNILDLSTSSSDEIKKSVDYIKESAITLDIFTKELSTFISELGQKGSDKKDT